MSNSGQAYHLLIEKIDVFIRKYYKNKLIKGSLYASGIILSFYLTLVLTEYLAEFGTTARTALFYSFLFSFLFVVYRFILTPAAGLYKLGKIITHEEAANIIGRHFSGVNDKLLNVLQLHHQQSEADNGATALLEAAIVQKTEELRPLPFTSVIDLSQNKKYIKYAALPAMVMIAMLLAAPNMITGPTKRLVAYDTYFEKQAPFRFVVLNKELKAGQHEDFLLEIETQGNTIPNEVTLETGSLRLRMSASAKNKFSYTFRNLQKDISFRLTGGGFNSADYLLKVLPKPKILSFTAELQFPSYLLQKNELLHNTGDLSVPAGTRVIWTFNTQKTERLHFSLNDSVRLLLPTRDNTFTTSALLLQNSSYTIVSENSQLISSDTLAFNVQVIPDQYPAIKSETTRDSASFKQLFFSGEISDDHGFHSLYFIIRNKQLNVLASASEKIPIAEKRIPVPFSKDASPQKFYFQWNLNEANANTGDEFEYYFEVRDNDAVNGFKASRTEIQTYGLPDKKELSRLNEKTTEKIKDQLKSGLEKTRDVQKQMAELNRKLLDKKELSWDDKKKMKELVQEQKELQNELEKMQKELREKNAINQELNPEETKVLEKQEQLEKLMQEMLSPEMKEKMKELEKMLEQMNKEKSQEALEKMKLDTKELEKELDRTLEIFKQMEVEQKMEKAIDDLRELAKKQEELAQKTESSKPEQSELQQKQNELNKEFENLKKDLEDLEKKNNELESPNDLGQNQQDKEEISNDMENSSKELSKKQNKKASGSQKNAAGKMQKMSDKMQKAMEEQMENGEDAKALRDILENLLSVSFDQEALMKEAQTINKSNPRYLQLIQKQKKLQDDSKMIEDSLFALSKRQPSISSVVNKEIADINMNMEKSIKNMVDRKQDEAASRQQYVMTGVNNLALMLSESLQQMMQQQQQQQNSKSKPGGGSCNKPGGQGKPKKQRSLSQMRSMQQQINDQIAKLKDQMAKQQGQDGNKPKPGGKQAGGKNGQSEQSGNDNTNEQLARLAAQQEALRREMQKAAEKFNTDGKSGNGQLQKLAEKMEKTETELVNKMITEETIRRQQEILTRLLEAEKSEREQDMDQKRESKEGVFEKNRNPELFLQYKALKQRETELLRTIPPDLKPWYRKKVNHYFNQTSSTP
jgi:hypothetical protein